jgi:hypothetical protein
VIRRQERSVIDEDQGLPAGKSGVRTPEEFFAGHPFGLQAFDLLRRTIQGFGPVQIRTTVSQVAFRHKRGFAYLWLPGRWLKNPAAEVVLSLALPRRLDSERFKEIVHPTKGIWIHHLELRRLADLNQELAEWLQEAYVGASDSRFGEKDELVS